MTLRAAKETAHSGITAVQGQRSPLGARREAGAVHLHRACGGGDDARDSDSIPAHLAWSSLRPPPLAGCTAHSNERVQGRSR